LKPQQTELHYLISTESFVPQLNTSLNQTDTKTDFSSGLASHASFQSFYGPKKAERACLITFWRYFDPWLWQLFLPVLTMR